MRMTQKRKTAAERQFSKRSRKMYYSAIVAHRKEIVKMAINELIIGNFAGGYAAAPVKANLPEMCGGDNK